MDVLQEYEKWDFFDLTKKLVLGTKGDIEICSIEW